MKKLEKEKNDDVLSSKHYTFLSYRYTCSRRCFYSYSKGKVHALLGMNGAGKSTLLKIATGEIQPVAGDIKIDNQSVSFTSPRDAKSMVFLS